MNQVTLYVGNKNYSSWSLRAWLTLRFGNIEFTERLVRLDQPGYGRGEIAEVRSITPTGQVPVLTRDSFAIWDTLAIAEWAAEQRPALWPADADDRARARSLCAEMHSGFVGVRRDLSMNIKRRCQARNLPQDTLAGIKRIDDIFASARGPHLFGPRGIVDAFFTPVATRMRTYSIALSPQATAYRDVLLADDNFDSWEAECIPDSWDASGYSVIDGLYR
jgi:glutathione S-transferase